jgi:hypothetical protein
MRLITASVIALVSTGSVLSASAASDQLDKAKKPNAPYIVVAETKWCKDMPSRGECLKCAKGRGYSKEQAEAYCPK